MALGIIPVGFMLHDAVNKHAKIRNKCDFIKYSPINIEKVTCEVLETENKHHVHYVAQLTYPQKVTIRFVDGLIILVFVGHDFKFQ